MRIKQPQQALSLPKGILLILASLFSPVFAHEWNSSRPDAHAPISVMGDHMHQAGEWMISYRFMTMDMDGNREGTDRLSPEDVLGRYMVTPLDMRMDMHMLGAMYAPSDRVTLMAMVPFLDVSMDHRTRNGMEFTTSASGIGDASLSALWRVHHGQNSRFHVQTGLRLDTGSIDERDDTPAMANARLPYPMQLGSGTYDAMLAGTYSAQGEFFSWGGQVKGTFPMGDNDRDYMLGNQYVGVAWLSRMFSSSFSVSVSLTGNHWEDIDGRDPDLRPAMVPTADPELRAGTRWDGGVGINILFKNGHRLALDWLIPLQQDLDGPQLETDQTLTIGWQFAF